MNIPHKEAVLAVADTFLDYLDEGWVDQIWLVGSRAPGSLKAPRNDSDWDFILVGSGFDEVEKERIRMSEEDILPFGCEWLSIGVRPGKPDIIFAGQAPTAGVKIYENGAWLE